MRSPERAILVVTHYQRLLDYIVPDFVHVLVDGRIVRSGGPELALELEEKGYGAMEAEAGMLQPRANENEGRTDVITATQTARKLPRELQRVREARRRAHALPGCGSCARMRLLASARSAFRPLTTRTGGSPTSPPSRRLPSGSRGTAAPALSQQRTGAVPDSGRCLSACVRERALCARAILAGQPARWGEGQQSCRGDFRQCPERLKRTSAAISISAAMPSAR